MQEEEITFDDVLNLIKSPEKSDRIIILNAEVISSSFMCFLNSIINRFEDSKFVHELNDYFMPINKFTVIELDEIKLSGFPNTLQYSEPIYKAKRLSSLFRIWNNLCIEKNIKLMVITNKMWGFNNVSPMAMTYQPYAILNYRTDNKVYFPKVNDPKFQHAMFDATVFARRAKMNQLNDRNQI